LQTGKEILEWFQHLLGSGQVGITGSRDFDFHEIAFCIDEGVSFASPDFFFPYQCLSLDLERHWFSWIGYQSLRHLAQRLGLACAASVGAGLPRPDPRCRSCATSENRNTPSPRQASHWAAIS